MNGYQYLAVFTNGAAPDATTTAATLTVNAALGIVPTTLPAGVVNTLYHQTITVSGGTTPYTTFTVSGFNAGGTGLTSSEITVNASAGTIVVNGTPTAAGSASFTVNVIDTVGATLSQSYAITVQPEATTTTVTDSPNPSVVGQPVTFTAIVSGVAPGAGKPTGSVTFKDGSTVLRTVSLYAQGKAAPVHFDPHRRQPYHYRLLQGQRERPGQQQRRDRTGHREDNNHRPDRSDVCPIGDLHGQSEGRRTGHRCCQRTSDLHGRQRNLGTRTLNSSGNATITVTTASVTGKTVTASYAGGGNFAARSASLAMTASHVATTTVLAASADPSPW